MQADREIVRKWHEKTRDLGLEYLSRSASRRTSTVNRYDRMHHRTSGARAYVDLPTQPSRARFHSGDTYAETQLPALVRLAVALDTLPVIGYHDVQPLTDLAELDRNV
jgi:hypothetical protein